MIQKSIRQKAKLTDIVWDTNFRVLDTMQKCSLTFATMSANDGNNLKCVFVLFYLFIFSSFLLVCFSFNLISVRSIEYYLQIILRDYFELQRHKKRTFGQVRVENL